MKVDNAETKTAQLARLVVLTTSEWNDEQVDALGHLVRKFNPDGSPCAFMVLRPGETVDLLDEERARQLRDVLNRVLGDAP